MAQRISGRIEHARSKALDSISQMQLTPMDRWLSSVTP